MKGILRKIISIIVCVALVASFAAFGNENNMAISASAAEAEVRDIYIRPVAGNVAAVAVGGFHIAVLRTDGTVAAIGDNTYGQCAVFDWKNVTKIWASDHATFALCKDGTVKTTGNHNIMGWTDIVNLFFGSGYFNDLVVGLKSDGTVVSASSNSKYTDPAEIDLSGWDRIVDVVVDEGRVLGLRDDGTVVYAGDEREDCTIGQWRNVAKLVDIRYHSVAITKDGRILWDCESDVTGFEACYLNDLTSKWRDVEKIVEGFMNAQYGITKDGRVFGFGGELGEVTFEGHEGIVDLAVGIWIGFALKRDGSVVTYPEDLASDPELLTSITKMVTNSSGRMTFLKEDGAVISGYIHDGTVEKKDWRNIVEIWEYPNVIGLDRDGNIHCDSFSSTELAILTEGVKDTKPQIEATGAIAAGSYHSVWIKEDGSVAAIGQSDGGRCDVSDWTDIIAVSASEHTVGLKSDGTVVAAGKNEYGKCDVQDWQNIVDIAAGSKNTVGLRADGTVVVAGSNVYKQKNVNDWVDIIDVTAGEKTVYGLTRDGAVSAAGSNASGCADVSGWSNIVAISAGNQHVVGLKADGTVVATGSNGYGQCNVDEWTDIVAISAGATHTVGLKSDGTVVSTGNNKQARCDVGTWRDIVAISAGMHHTIGKMADGTLVAVGSDTYGQCKVVG